MNFQAADRSQASPVAPGIPAAHASPAAQDNSAASPSRRAHRALGTLAILAATLLTACHAPAQATQQSTQPTTQPTTQASQITLPRTSSTPAAGTRDAQSGLNWLALSALPKQGQQTYALIVRGGPFPYARDGVVYQNREGVLPRRSRGSYHEYTVKTPGSSDRGARRIVCAELPECYYTADHYASFSRIRP